MPDAVTAFETATGAGPVGSASGGDPTDVLGGTATHPLEMRAQAALAQHAAAVRRCRAELDGARGLLPGVRAHDGPTLASPGVPANDVVGLVPWRDPAAPAAGMRGVSAWLKAASGQSALIAGAHHLAGAAQPTGWDGFFEELGTLLGAAGLALAALGGGTGGGGALALAGGAVAAPAAAPIGGAIAAGAAAGIGLAVVVASIVKHESPGDVLSDILHGNKIAGKPEINLHDLAELNRSKIPPDVLKEVDDAIARAKIGKVWFEGHDGKRWKNDDHGLPIEPSDYYHEWTAAANGKPRGDFRIIIGGNESDPDAICFWDHSDNAPVYIGPIHP